MSAAETPTHDGGVFAALDATLIASASWCAEKATRSPRAVRTTTSAQRGSEATPA